MTAKDAQGIEQTGTRREQTVDVICCSKPVVDDYSKNSNTGDSIAQCSDMAAAVALF